LSIKKQHVPLFWTAKAKIVLKNVVAFCTSDVCVFMSKTTKGGKTDVADVGRLEWDHVRRPSTKKEAQVNAGPTGRKPKQEHSAICVESCQRNWCLPGTSQQECARGAETNA
jgi:hypothetical protein